MPSSLPPHGVLPISPMSGIELPQTIKLIAGGYVQGIISFKPHGSTRNYFRATDLTVLLQVNMRKTLE